MQGWPERPTSLKFHDQLKRGQSSTKILQHSLIVLSRSIIVQMSNIQKGPLSKYVSAIINVAFHLIGRSRHDAF